MIHAVFGSVWPPMHQREVLAAGGATLTDSLHIMWAVLTGLFFMFETGFGAAMLGTRFRFYSVATMVIGLACGAMTGRYTAEIQANLPTPGAGAWERIGVTAYMVWIAVTRAAATDVTSRAKFRCYWALASPGIALIRRLSLEPLQLDAERRALTIAGARNRALLSEPRPAGRR